MDEDGEVEVSSEDGAARARAAEALVKEVEVKKVEGNDRFREGESEAALQCYDEALAMLADTPPAPALGATLCANQALCLLKLERWEEAEARATKALNVDSAHSKAIYRRGLARLRLGNVRGALDDLQKAGRLEPNNREVRERCEEARKLVDELPVDAAEVAVASGAAGALGSAGGKQRELYEEKPDLNEGRIADTHRIQRDWIATISDWTEITDISFAEEEAKAQISVYMGLPGLNALAPNKICVWFHATSLEVRIIDLNGKNWVFLAQELWGQIDPERSSYKVRRDKLSLKLAKRESARSWDKWEKLRRI